MMKIEKKNFVPEKIPKETGYYFLSDKDNILFCSETANLQHSLTKLFSASIDNKNILQLISLTKNISYSQTDSLFSALLQAKIIRSKHHPEFNKMIIQNPDLVYLAIDFHKVPFLKITEHTTEAYFYLGPFPNRFFLCDLVDVMADIMKLPSCENENFPCRNLKEKNCSGWCLKEKQQIAEKLISNYLEKNEEVCEKIDEEIEKLQKNLQFQKAENLKVKQKLIRKYYNHLKFLHVTKKIDFNLRNYQVHLSDGLISKLYSNNTDYDFKLTKPEYRENEFLAHDKSEYQERIIIYQHLSKNKLEQINDIYKESIWKMKKILK